MLRGQFGTAAAFIRLRACAYARDRSVPGLVRDIGVRRLRLCPGLGRAGTARRETAHAYPRWPDLLAVPKRVSGMDAELLSETFVELTDTMVAGFDVIDFMHVLTDRSVQLLDVSAAGLLLADPRGELRVVAASSETRPAARVCSSCKTTRVRAWTASGPASPSRPRTWPRRRRAGRGSRPPRGRPGSPRCRPCRCGCASRSSAR